MKKIFLFSLSLALPLLCGCANDNLANGCKVTDFDDEKVTMDYIDFLTDYEGYLDNVEVLDDIYAKQDYDQDQKPDRVYNTLWMMVKKCMPYALEMEKFSKLVHLKIP